MATDAAIIGDRSALVLFSGGQDSATCLAWALDRSAAEGRPDVTVRAHAASALDVTDGPRRSVVLSNGEVIPADVVVLAVGHVDVEPAEAPHGDAVGVGNLG